MSEKSKFEVLYFSRDSENRFGLKTLLTANKCDVHGTHSRVRALQLMSISQIDLVIADVGHPKRTGIEFCRIFRAERKHKTVPIVLIGEDDENGKNCVSAFAAGADDYVTVPFVNEVCLARINRFLVKNLAGGATSVLSVHVSAGDLPGILQYLEGDIKTGKLNIRRDDDTTAVLYFREGRLVNATAPYCVELEAITEVLSWDSSYVTFQEVEIQESDAKYDNEVTGLLMNCVVDVDEYREIQNTMPPDNVMFLAGSREPDAEMNPAQKNMYDLAVKGFATEDLLDSQKSSHRKTTLWLHNLIEDGYLKVAPPPFERYPFTAYETYCGLQMFKGRMHELKGALEKVTFPLPKISATLPFGANDWIAPAPKIVLTGDDFDHMSILVQSLSTITSSISELKPLVKKHRKGVVTTRLFLDAKLTLDIQQLPPAFDKLMLNTFEEYLTDTYGVIFMVSGQDRKANEENMRLLRLLRQRFKGVYNFLVPKVANSNGIFDFRMDCTNCGYRLSVDMSMAGSMGECPICKGSLTVPDCLDHLAHSLHLPDDVMIVQIEPVVHVQCRDLIMLFIDAVLNAYKQPVIETEPVVVETHHHEAMEVRERDLKVGKKMLTAAEETVFISGEEEVREALAAVFEDVANDAAESPAVETSRRRVDEEIDPTALDQILNSSEGNFDIDEFIKKVRRD